MVVIPACRSPHQFLQLIAAEEFRYAMVPTSRRDANVCIMHQDPELTHLVDVLAVDFEIVDGLGGLMEGEMQDNRGTAVALERLALGQLTERDPVAAVQ